VSKKNQKTIIAEETESIGKDVVETVVEEPEISNISTETKELELRKSLYLPTPTLSVSESSEYGYIGLGDEDDSNNATYYFPQVISATSSDYDPKCLPFLTPISIGAGLLLGLIYAGIATIKKVQMNADLLTAVGILFSLAILVTIIAFIAFPKLIMKNRNSADSENEIEIAVYKE